MEAIVYVLKVLAVALAVGVISVVVAAICAIIDGIAAVNTAGDDPSSGARSHEEWH
jgi:hypothetical protein